MSAPQLNPVDDGLTDVAYSFLKTNIFWQMTSKTGWNLAVRKL